MANLHTTYGTHCADHCHLGVRRIEPDKYSRSILSVAFYDSVVVVERMPHERSDHEEIRTGWVGL